MSSFTPFPKEIYSEALAASLDDVAVGPSLWGRLRLNGLMFAAAAFLVSVPVVLQAALVRSLPAVSLILTGGWLWLSLVLKARSSTRFWGDLLLGFTWTWLAGSVYWGWLRWEPLWHLPIEAIGLPFAVAGLSRGWGKIGNWFYLGSLLGTAVTDLYFYFVKLIPHWRQIMQTDPSLVQPIFQSALAQVQTPWGIECALVLAILLLMVGCFPLRFQAPHWWAFSGAALSTILVDGLFLLAAMSA